MTDPCRFDRVDFATGSELKPAKKLDNGHLLVEGRISRVGVQEYPNQGGGMHRELRLPEDVFDEESLASFRMVPVTNTHPPTLLDARTSKEYTVGAVGENVRRDGEDFVAAPMAIYDAEAIQHIDVGRTQLSCGYSCELEEVTGVHPVYGHYDAIQRKIRGNHVALVDVARAGAQARLRLDSGDVVVIASSHRSTTTEEPRMPPTLHVDGLTLEMTEANAGTIRQAIERGLEKVKKDGADALSALQNKFDAASIEVSTLKKKLGLVKVNVESLNKRRDAARARMMPCDACDGTGMVAEQKCDYCDGAGSFRMHDAIKGAVGEPDGEQNGTEDADAVDANELQAEQSTESEAKAAHKDSLLQEAAKKGLARRRAWLDAFAEKRVTRRAPLIEAAHRHLGPDEKLDGLSDSAIKAKIVEKLKPGFKIAEKSSAAKIDALYEVALHDAGQAPSAADVLRGAVTTPSVPATQRGSDAARANMLKHNQDAWKRPTSSAAK